jgi:hypothetical protein
MTLDENDFLAHQLYTASKSPRVQKGRRRRWIFTTVSLVAMSFIFFESYKDVLGYYFLVLSVLSLFFYPMYSRWYYKRHYRNYIRDEYKNRFGREVTLEINDDVILATDNTSESKIDTSEVEAINEIKDYYFVKLTSGVSVIISKTKEKDIDKITTALKSLAEKRGIKFNEELDWKWK